MWAEYAPAVRSECVRGLVLWNEINFWRWPERYSPQEYAEILREYVREAKRLVGDLPVCFKAAGMWRAEPVIAAAAMADGLGFDIWFSRPDDPYAMREIGRVRRKLEQRQEKTTWFFVAEGGRIRGEDGEAFEYPEAWPPFHSKQDARGILLSYAHTGVKGFIYNGPPPENHPEYRDSYRWLGQLRPEITEVMVRTNLPGEPEPLGTADEAVHAARNDPRVREVLRDVGDVEVEAEYAYDWDVWLVRFLRDEREVAFASVGPEGDVREVGVHGSEHAAGEELDSGDPVPASSGHSVLDYGARGDGRTNDAAAIQRAIDECAERGGGRVTLSAGRTYRTGTIHLRANVDLHVERGATLKGSTDPNDYGEERALIVARDANNIAISGGGTIDGDGLAWMSHQEQDIFRPRPGRPGLIHLRGCDHATITEITIRKSAAWTVHLLGCEDVLVEGIRIVNDLRIPNCDGIASNHCRNVRIANCLIQAGDDGIVMKNTSRYGEYGPCENLTVTGCTITSRSCAIKIGTESTDDFRNFVINSCVIHGSNRGLGIQLRDGGTVENILFSDIVIETKLHGPRWWGKAEPIYVTAIPRTSDTKLGKVRNVRFSNILCRGENGVFLHGWEGSPIENVTFDNVRIEIDKTTDWPGGLYDTRPGIHRGVYEHKTAGLYLHHARDVELEDVEVAWGENRPDYFGPALETHHVTGLALEDFQGQAAHPEQGPNRILD